MSNHSLLRMKRSAKIGTYTFVMGVIVLAVLIIANLIVNALPAKVTRFDLTGMGMTEISDKSEAFVSELTEDVTIYWLCENGTVDDQFRLLLTRYEEVSDHIRLEIVDPLEVPTFTSAYTEETLSDLSFIIESDRRYCVVDLMDMYYFTHGFLTEYYGTEMFMTYDELYNFVNTYGYAYDFTGYEITQYFCGEARLTSAIDYVTKESIPHAYLLTGHDEATPSEDMYDLMASWNITLESLSLQNATAVPADAACVILYAPTTDISDHEATLLKTYLDNGGSVIMTTAPANVASCPNLMSVGAHFGLIASEGVVREGDQSYVSGTSLTTLLPPTINQTHFATKTVYEEGFKNPSMPQAHAITVAELLPDGVTATPLFSTSDTATRVSLADTTQVMEGAEKMSYHVAAAASKNFVDADGEIQTGNLIWYASASAFTDEQAEATSGANYYYFVNTVSGVTGEFVSSFEDLPAASVSGEFLRSLTYRDALILGAIMVIVLPLTLLTTGIVIWVKRRRR